MLLKIERNNRAHCNEVSVFSKNLATVLHFLFGYLCIRVQIVFQELAETAEKNSGKERVLLTTVP